MSDFFPYRLDRRWQIMFTAMRVNSDDGVTIARRESDSDTGSDTGSDTDSDTGAGTGTLRATFGFLELETTLDNIDHTLITGPHRFYTAVGARLSFADDGLTFGTNHRRGLCIAFKERVPKVIGLRPHSALWVSVADPEGLAAALGC